MASYEGALIDLVVDSARTAIDKILTYTAAELETVNADPSYATITCVAAEQELLPASYTRIAFVRSLTGAPLDVYGWLIIHYKMDYLRSWEGVSLLTLYGLPASTFGYVRAITITRLGRPVPFLTTVLDAALPTGLITGVRGKSSTVLQKLKYVVRGRRSNEEYESDELDLSGAIPPEVTVTIRRKRSAQLNRKKMR